MLGHGGDLVGLSRKTGRSPEEILDFSANINPLGPPDWLRAVVNRNLERITHYPDPACTELVASIARKYSLKPEQVLIGNGSTGLLHALPRACDAKRVVICVPCYIDYANAAELAGLEILRVPLNADDDFALDWDRLEGELRGDELVFLGNPNNPTGRSLDVNRLQELACARPDALFAIDEAFTEFLDGPRELTTSLTSNIVSLRSMTKLYAIPGLRLGFAVAPETIAMRMRAILAPWSVNVLAQAVGVAALEDDAYISETRALVSSLRATLHARLAELPGLQVFPGEANYLLSRLDRTDISAEGLAQRLLEKGIAIRVCDNYDGLDLRYFRVAVRTEDENERLLEALRSVLVPGKPRSRPRRTPALMFQGTSSNAGKSILAAAMCRILLQDGIRVAPFKAQNMSLNSYVTRDGGEMGRAQVVQAQACRLEPDVRMNPVRMNPVLLKPSSDTGSQVIVRGKPVGQMKVKEYVGYKTRAFEAVKACYDSLASEYDAIVLEGAGSPAEVNLKHHDIVNLAMARYARAPRSPVSL